MSRDDQDTSSPTTCGEVLEKCSGRAFGAVVECVQVSTLAMDGIRLKCNDVEMTRLILAAERAKKQAPDLDEQERMYEKAREESALARRQVSEQFPLLIGQSTIVLWAILESFVDDVAFNIMRVNPSLLRTGPIADAPIKIPLARFLSMGEEEQYEALLDLYKATTGVSRRDGVNGFEAVLKSVGLDGAVEAHIKDRLRNLKLIRNLYAHQAGKADRRYLESQPAIIADLGELVCVGHSYWVEMWTAAYDYLVTVVNRQRAQDGGEPAEFLFFKPGQMQTAVEETNAAPDARARAADRQQSPLGGIRADAEES